MAKFTITIVGRLLVHGDGLERPRLTRDDFFAIADEIGVDPGYARMFNRIDRSISVIEEFGWYIRLRAGGDIISSSGKPMMTDDGVLFLSEANPGNIYLISARDFYGTYQSKCSPFDVLRVPVPLSMLEAR